MDNHTGQSSALPVLEARGLTKSFGGIAAVKDVSLAVSTNETVGLIGPNGAGKTTLFGLLTGFTRPDQGAVRLAGLDISRLGPEQRGRRGLIRSFQDAALFPTLTVSDTIRLAFEPTIPSGLLRSVAGLQGAEAQRQAGAVDLIDVMGLGPYARIQIQELSTGTRRIVELACMMALSPSVLLLDEPCAGIAQRETEALAQLLAKLRKELALTMLIIEHDLPMIMSIADRVVALDLGSVLAVGTPLEIQGNPDVIAAYFGENCFDIQPLKGE